MYQLRVRLNEETRAKIKLRVEFVPAPIWQFNLRSKQADELTWQSDLISLSKAIDPKDPSTLNNVVGPDAKEPGTLFGPRDFNLMFKTRTGPVEHSANSVMAAAPIGATGPAGTIPISAGAAEQPWALTAGTSIVSESASPAVVEKETSVAYLRPETAQSSSWTVIGLLWIALRRSPPR